MVKQKTVRFYETSNADMEAFDKLNKCREYGCNTARELIIAAINQYSSDGGCKSAIPFDIDDLATRIATKLNGVVLKEQQNQDETLTANDNEEAFSKALSFINTL